MCRFKSGIIFKDRIVIAPIDNDSHSDLLESLGVEDDYFGAAKKFVRAELFPEDDKFWISPEEHPEKWEFIVDQDITPEWFDEETYEEQFRQSVIEWWKMNVTINQKIEKLDSGYHILVQCDVESICGDAVVLLYSSNVGSMYGKSRVYSMYGDSKVISMFDNSWIFEMYGKSKVVHMFNNSIVSEMFDNSSICEMCSYSLVGGMHCESKITYMGESSRVNRMSDNSRVDEMHGYSHVDSMSEDSQICKMFNYSSVNRMVGNSKIVEMCGLSMARDFNDYPLVKIICPPSGEYEIVRLEKEGE